MDKKDVIYITTMEYYSVVKIMKSWDFPGGPVAKTLCSQHRGPRFDP